jgi:hypothetical protein
MLQTDKAIESAQDAVITQLGGIDRINEMRIKKVVIAPNKAVSQAIISAQNAVLIELQTRGF